MSRQTNVEVLDEVGLTYSHGATLCLQAARYHHPDGTNEDGFRFVWKDAAGHMKVLRGQTRLPDLRVARLLMAKAENRPAFRNHRGSDADNGPGTMSL